MEAEVSSRILNKDLKDALPELINLSKLNLEDEGNVCVSVLTTEDFVYLNMDFKECSPLFTEKIGLDSVGFIIVPGSVDPQRYFDLKEEKIELLINDENGIACYLGSFFSAKFKIIDHRLRLEKVSTSYNSSHYKTFFDKSDSIYLNQIGILREEPEPTPSN